MDRSDVCRRSGGVDKSGIGGSDGYDSDVDRSFVIADVIESGSEQSAGINPDLDRWSEESRELESQGRWSIGHDSIVDIKSVESVVIGYGSE